MAMAAAAGRLTGPKGGRVPPRLLDSIGDRSEPGRRRMTQHRRRHSVTRLGCVRARGLHGGPSASPVGLRRPGWDLGTAPAGVGTLFAAAFDLARVAAAEALAADAAHMAALAAGHHAEMVAWTRPGVELAERATDPDARYWLGPLFNNLNWVCFDAGQYEEALEAFQWTLRARESDPRRPAETEIARYAVPRRCACWVGRRRPPPCWRRRWRGQGPSGSRMAGSTRSWRRPTWPLAAGGRTTAGALGASAAGGH
jgi:hypothetical protein